MMSDGIPGPSIKHCGGERGGGEGRGLVEQNRGRLIFVHQNGHYLVFVEIEF